MLKIEQENGKCQFLFLDIYQLFLHETNIFTNTKSSHFIEQNTGATSKPDSTSIYLQIFYAKSILYTVISLTKKELYKGI